MKCVLLDFGRGAGASTQELGRAAHLTLSFSKENGAAFVCCMSDNVSYTLAPIDYSYAAVTIISTFNTSLASFASPQARVGA